MSENYYLSQQKETPIQVCRRQRYTLRYAYARAAETRAENETGQDFLAFRADEDTLVFALCDGVSQSFFGDLAARFLGESLIDWLWKNDFRCTDAEVMAQNMESFLHSLTEAATKQVQVLPLPEDMPAMFRDVLEEKRALGSESTFICGRIDFQKENQPGQIYLGWMGDSRLRVWTNDDELTIFQSSEFLTRERWSTRQGPVNGVPHVFCDSLDKEDQTITRFMLYSDGFALLDEYDLSLPTQNIQDLIVKSWSLPESDDISFLEIWLQPYPVVLDHLHLIAPEHIQVHPEEDTLRIAWKAVKGATSYEVELEGIKSFRRKKVKNNHITLKLHSSNVAMRVRAITDSISGPWGAWTPLPAPIAVSAGHNTESIDNISPPPPPPPPESVKPPPSSGGSYETKKPKSMYMLVIIAGSFLFLCIGLTFLAAYGILKMERTWIKYFQTPATIALTPTSTPIKIYIPPLRVTPSSPPTFSPFPTVTLQLTPMPSVTPTSTPTPTPSPTATSTTTLTPSVTPTPTFTTTPTSTSTPSPTATPTTTPTPSVTPTPTLTVTPTSTPTPTLSTSTMMITIP